MIDLTETANEIREYQKTEFAERVSDCYMLWFRLDQAGFKLTIRNGRLHLHDNFETIGGSSRTAKDFIHDVETARAICQLAEADHAALAAYVEQKGGKPGSFSIDQVLDQLQTGGTGSN